MHFSPGKTNEICLSPIEMDLFLFSIHLNTLKESEAGFYTCEVSNGFQTLTSTGFVRVKNPGRTLSPAGEDRYPRCLSDVFFSHLRSDRSE